MQVPETEDESTSRSDYAEFSKLLLDGQKIAIESGKTHIFTWRGYKACISNQIPQVAKTS